MDFQEFQESHLIFSSDYSWNQINGNENEGNGIHRHRHGQCKSLSLARNDERKKEKQQMMISSSPMSVPVNIPVGIGFCRYYSDMAVREPFDPSSDEDQDDDDDDYDDEIMGRLPPHLIVERRVSGEIARSFSPLKGRHLCHVRNSILRMTGFLER